MKKLMDVTKWVSYNEMSTHMHFILVVFNETNKK